MSGSQTYYRSAILPLLLGLLIFCNCGLQKTESEGVVAQVNHRKIAPDELVFAYELAPRTVTQRGAEEAVREVLDYLIDRILLAEEAQRRGLDRDSSLQRVIDYYTDAEIVRELYRRHIRDSIRIKERELRREYKRSGTTLFVKNYVSTDLAIAREIRKRSDNPQHFPINAMAKTIQHPEHGSVDMIKWNVLQQELEDFLLDLPVHERSEPFYDGDRYHVFEVVGKEREAFATENDFAARRASLETVIRKRREHAAAFRFVQRVMQDQDLLIRGPVITKICDALWAMYGETEEYLPQFIPMREVREYRRSLGELREAVLAQYRDGSMTAEDFIFYYTVHPLQIACSSEAALHKSLQDAVAIYVRDRVFADLGKEEGLAESHSVQKERQQWAEKLSANRLKTELRRELKASQMDSLQYDSAYQNDLRELLAVLRENANIRIHEERLANLKLSDRGVNRKIDFVAAYR